MVSALGDYDLRNNEGSSVTQVRHKMVSGTTAGTSANWADTDGYLPPEILT